jgi:hypothetical protein
VVISEALESGVLSSHRALEALLSFVEVLRLEPRMVLTLPLLVAKAVTQPPEEQVVVVSPSQVKVPKLAPEATVAVLSSKRVVEMEQGFPVRSPLVPQSTETRSTSTLRR